MIRRAAAAAALLCIALALGGCGLLGGGRASRPSSRSSPGPATSAPVGGRRGSTSSTPSASTAASTAGSASRSATAIARTRRTHELPTPAGSVHVTGGWRTPAEAVNAFASVYINWTATTVASRLRALARASVGQARAEMSTEALQTDRDRELRAGEIANAGTVESVAELGGDPRSSADPRSYTVVTRERTSAARDAAYRGLVSQWHVSVATATRLSDGLWVVSRWQPES